MSKIFENGVVSSTSGADNFIINDLIITGDIHFVDSVNGNDGNSGTDESPLATLGQAVTNSTANNGDVIVVKQNHVETLAGAIALSKAGVKIFGVGSGISRPTFTVDGAFDGLNVTAARVEVNNLRFVQGTTAPNTSHINVSAAGCKIKGCAFELGVNDLECITLTTGCVDPIIESCVFEIKADGPDAGIEIEDAGVLGLVVRSCSFDGGIFNWDNAAIHSTVAHTEYVYDTNTLTSGADIIHTAAAKGYVTGNIAGDSSHVQVCL